jgi:hypothetical protein
MAIRDLQLCLLANGGAELVDVETDVTVWASDSDEDYAEEFPELLDENDVEHLQDYLEQHECCTSRELETMEIITEPLDGEEDDEDEDDHPDWDGDAEDDGDIIDGEVIES